MISIAFFVYLWCCKIKMKNKDRSFIMKKLLCEKNVLFEKILYVCLIVSAVACMVQSLILS
jgi:hypothetical protein